MHRTVESNRNPRIIQPRKVVISPGVIDSGTEWKLPRIRSSDITEILPFPRHNDAVLIYNDIPELKNPDADDGFPKPLGSSEKYEELDESKWIKLQDLLERAG